MADRHGLTVKHGLSVEQALTGASPGAQVYLGRVDRGRRSTWAASTGRRSTSGSPEMATWSRTTWIRASIPKSSQLQPAVILNHRRSS
jgi:hypothetical protein